MPLTTKDQAPIRLPVQLRALNTLGPALQRFGLLNIHDDPERYLKWAQQKTGLVDFGPCDIRLPLEKLLYMLKHEADLSLFGRIGTMQLLQRNLVNNLLLQDAFTRQPELSKVDVESPIIIICTLRTGSTLLHKLMSLHPGMRAPKLWELHRPCPAPLPRSAHCDPRIKQSDREFGMFYRLVPDMRAIHYFAPEAVEECTHLFLNLLTCRISFGTLANANSYTDWVMQHDMEDAYRAYKRYLQVLKLNYPTSTLVLKSPLHMMQLDALAKVFPKARIVHLHRDPATAAGSFCSLTEAIQISMRNSVDTRAIGELWQKFWVPALNHSVEWRKAGKLQVLDINYDDLIANPASEVEAIFRHFGEQVPGTLASSISQYLHQHPTDEYGVHEFSLARYGLDRGLLYEQHRHYMEYFGLPRQAQPPV